MHAAFDDFSQVLSDQGVDKVNAVFMDLGLSSLQIDETERGFSYSHDAPLDMRMDVTQPLTAEQVLAEYSFADLVRIFRTYGEERFSKQIAREIVRRRETEPLTTSGQLNRLVDEVVPQAHRPAGNPRNASSRRCASKSTANWTSLPARCRKSPTTLQWEDVWWWSRTTRWKTKPSKPS